MDQIVSQSLRDVVHPERDDPLDQRQLRASIMSLLENGEAWRFKDMALKLRSEGLESEVYRELRALIRSGAVRRVRHGVYMAVGPYDWNAPIEAEAGTPVIQAAIYSQLHRLRTVDELRTMLSLPREVVWRSLRALVQSGAVRTGEPLGVFREMTFIRSDQPVSGEPAEAGETAAVDRAVLDCIQPGRVYSAHTVAVMADIQVKTVKLALRKLATLGAIRCFAFDDGLYFYLTDDRAQAEGPEATQTARPVDLYAEFGAVNLATLGVIVSAESGVTAHAVSRELAEVFRGSRNTAARIITKLRRAGLLQVREATPEEGTIWEATDIGVDLMAMARGDSQAESAHHAEVRYEVPPEAEGSAHLRLASWILDTARSADGTLRRRIPVNKRLLSRSLNITVAHLNKCLRILEAHGVTVDGWDLVLAEPERLAELGNA